MSHAARSISPLRRILRIRVGVLVSSAVLLIGAGFFFIALDPMVTRIAENQFSSATRQIETRLGSVFHPAEQILRMSPGWIGKTPPDIEHPEAFNRIFRPILETLPQATSVVAGTSSGQGWMLLQLPDGRWQNRLTDRSRWGERHLFFEQHADGETLKIWKTLDYDPRVRAWFKASADTRGKISWTAPYTFFTTGDPGITASISHALEDGRVFVTGLDLKLRDLSLTTMDAKIGQHGMALIITEDQRTLALPRLPDGIDREDWLNKTLQPVAELGLGPLNDALSLWQSGRSKGVISYRTGLAPWLMQIHPYSVGDKRFLLVTLAPESDFSLDRTALAGILLAALALMLIPVTWFSRQQAGHIARPLEALALASERIGNLDFHPLSLAASNISEVVQLAAAHEKMRTLLEEDQQKIATQQQELYRQIDALRAAEAALKESEYRWKFAIEGSGDGVFDWNLQTGESKYSRRWKEMLGYQEDEILPRHEEWLDRIHPEDQVHVAETVRAYLAGETPVYTVEYRLRCKDESYKWILSRGIIVSRSDDGRPQRLIGTHTDITDRKLAEEKLHLAASVFSHAREGIMITTADGTIIDVNEMFSQITGYSRDEALGQTPRLFKSGRHKRTFYAAMWRDLLENGGWSGELWNRRKNGEIFPEMLTISAVCDSQKRVCQYVALFSDITAIKAHQRELEHLAHFDPLTHLPNRVLLADRLQQAMIQTERRGTRLAVAYLDLDGFKTVNDMHGHETGDQLLVALAERMRLTLRESDTLARLGGDEFVAILLDLPEISTSGQMLSRLLSAAAQPVEVGELTLQVSSSLGVTFYPQADEVDADHLLRQADQAMYQAKLSGKNRFHVFDAEQDRSVRGHHESLEHVRRALEQREFVLYYQPKVNMRTGEIIGAEALIRWQHPQQGLLPPASFLPVIENHPLAVDVGQWVIEEALAQMENWLASGLHLPVSVNIGARQLQQPDFVDRIRAALAAHPAISPGDLEMEVLETSALEDLAGVSRIIESCRNIGVNFSLDDFGTGYSSLTYLKRLSVNQLKIDQSFVRDMLDDPDDLAILGGVLSLATSFRRQVIAEGVETVKHGTLLLQLGCELAQGYGIARPMPPEKLPEWTRTWHPDKAWSNLPAVDRDDLPLLFAEVEHRAWIVAIEAFLRGERETLPLIHHHCRFAQWLKTEGQSRHAKQPAFAHILTAHPAVHALANELMALHAARKYSLTQNKLHELHGQWNFLLDKIRELIKNRT